MFGSKPIGNPLSFGRVLGGLSKTLGVVNQIIPIYKEAKPMIQNARNAFSIIKEFSNNTTNRIETKKIENIAPIKDAIKNAKIQEYKKGPTFFQ